MFFFSNFDGEKLWEEILYSYEDDHSL